MHSNFLKLMRACLFSRVQLSATPWTAAWQAPLSVGFSRQECCKFPTPGTLSNPGIEPHLLHCQADSFITEPPGKPLKLMTKTKNPKLSIPIYAWCSPSHLSLLSKRDLKSKCIWWALAHPNSRALKLLVWHSQSFVSSEQINRAQTILVLAGSQ